MAPRVGKQAGSYVLDRHAPGTSLFPLSHTSHSPTCQHCDLISSIAFLLIFHPITRAFVCPQSALRGAWTQHQGLDRGSGSNVPFHCHSRRRCWSIGRTWCRESSKERKGSKVNPHLRVKAPAVLAEGPPLARAAGGLSWSGLGCAGEAALALSNEPECGSLRLW
jgi:hypothetical protein